jgi:hypothetical protein
VPDPASIGAREAATVPRFLTDTTDLP